MTGFEPQTSGIGSNHSANLATTTAHSLFGIIFRSVHALIIKSTSASLSRQFQDKSLKSFTYYWIPDFITEMLLLNPCLAVDIARAVWPDLGIFLKILASKSVTEVAKIFGDYLAMFNNIALE